MSVLSKLADALAGGENPTVKNAAIDALTDNTGQAINPTIYERLKNSAAQMFDENGKLMRFYHGTPAGDFDRFNDGSYFTPNKWYADMYQDPVQSSISFGKKVTNPRTYETYLDIQNPFDLSNPAARKIYIDEYIKGGNATGISPYLSQRELDAISDIDWTEVEGLMDFLKERGTNFDAIIANEGGFLDSAGKTVDRGKSYVPFSGDQVIILK